MATNAPIDEAGKLCSSRADGVFGSHGGQRRSPPHRSVHLVSESMAGIRGGVARGDLTPPTGHSMSSYDARRRVSSGVPDPLFAQAFTRDDGNRSVARVTLDLIFTLGRAEMDAIRTRVRASIGIDDVVFVASHTRSGGRSSDGVRVLCRRQFAHPHPRAGAAGCLSGTGGSHSVGQPGRLVAGRGRREGQRRDGDVRRGNLAPPPVMRTGRCRGVRLPVDGTLRDSAS